jgi:cell filamentation protein, protein adenylyltransferase
VQVDRFQASPIGRLVPISGHDGRLGRDFNHFAFVPEPLPTRIALSQATYSLLSEADRALGGLEAKTGLLPNPQLLVRPALTKEAVATSALEGTYAPLEDVLEAEYVKSAVSEVREVRNYIAAATRGLEIIPKKPICVSVLSELQKILVRGTRGDSYDAGQLRTRQVCIGDEGLPIEDSRFVPPPPGDELIRGMDDWEKWINDDFEMPVLVKAALAHYQFETLHPFSDGNGRLGRLVITLQLMQERVLSFPILNLSIWLEPRRSQYMDHLLNVSATGGLDRWVAFFAEAVKARARAGSETISLLLSVKEELVNQVQSYGYRGSAVTLAGDLIGYPVLDVRQAQRMLGISYQAANSAVGKLEELGILREVSGGNYGRVFRCQRVFDVIARA